MLRSRLYGRSRTMPHRKLITRLQSVAGLSQQDQVRLTTMPYKIKTLENGDYLLREGDRPTHSTVVMSGFLSRQRVISDRNQISSFYIPGDMPDLHSLHLPLVDHELCSVGTSTVASVPHAYFRDVMTESPGLTQAFWRETVIHAAIYREWVENLGARRALGRIAHLLCELATRLGRVDSWDSQISGNVIQGFLLGGSLGRHGSAQSERWAMGSYLRLDHRSTGPARFDGPRQPHVHRGRVVDRANRFAVA